MFLPYDDVTIRYMIVQPESWEMYAAFGKMHAERAEMPAEAQRTERIL